MLYRYRITVEYDGTDFYGWQRQDGLPTVQQALEDALLPLSKDHTVVYGAGRTDTGVHAIGQVAHFDLAKDVDPFRVQECLNFHLLNMNAAAAVIDTVRVPNDFDARFNAIERSYIYKIMMRRAPLVLLKNRYWHIKHYLDVENMQKAAQYLIGKHDFSAFRAAGCQATSPIKTINSISIEQHDQSLSIEIKARSFLYRQVRNIVGSLYMVGCGKWSPEQLYTILQSKDRRLSGQTAPACGLYFQGVKY